MSLFNELKRRNVFRVAIGYIVSSWLLAQVADLVLENIGSPDWVMQTILLVLALGFPVVVFFSWAYEVTPDGIKRESEIDRSQSITHITGRKLDHAIVAVLVIALAYFAYDKFVLSSARDVVLIETAKQAKSEPAGARGQAAPSTEQPVLARTIAKNSIAVLPFVNMSSDTEQEYFSDGISEEILNALTKIPGLHVTSRSSAFSFKGKDIDIPTVAAQLGVANVLEGSVRKAGLKVRITAQLIEAETDRHLWSETYDRELVDIFAIQDEISAAIVAALRGHLDSGDNTQVLSAKRPTSSTQAYEAYLRGRHLVVRRTQASVAGAVNEFSEAIRLDPKFALAYAELAIAYTLSINDQYGELIWSEARALAVPLAKRAMELNPTLAESHAAAGMVIWNVSPPPETFVHFENALRLDPNNAQILLWLGLAYDLVGDYEKVIPLGEKLLRIDPLSIPGQGNLALNYVQVGRDEDSEKILVNLATMSPANEQNIRGAIHSLKGEYARATFSNLHALQLENRYPNARRDLAWTLAQMELSDDSLAVEFSDRYFVYFYLGRYEQLVNILTQLSPEDQRLTENQRQLGRAYAARGDYKKALPLLETAWVDTGRSSGTINYSGFDVFDVAALVAARKAAQAGTETGDLVVAISNNVERQKAAGRKTFEVAFNEGIAAWFAGNTDDAISFLLSAVNDGLYLPLDLHYLKGLYSMPGFGAVQEAQQARTERERKIFLGEVCGDNAYSDVWQPLPESCDVYLQ